MNFFSTVLFHYYFPVTQKIDCHLGKKAAVLSILPRMDRQIINALKHHIEYVLSSGKQSGMQLIIRRH